MATRFVSQFQCSPVETRDQAPDSYKIKKLCVLCASVVKIPASVVKRIWPLWLSVFWPLRLEGVKNMKVPFLDLVTPHVELEEELIEVVREALHSARFIGGPQL